MIKDNNTKNISFNKEICFLILGHEINQETFELSESGKERCELLYKLISGFVPIGSINIKLPFFFNKRSISLIDFSKFR